MILYETGDSQTAIISRGRKRVREKQDHVTQVRFHVAEGEFYDDT